MTQPNEQVKQPERNTPVDSTAFKPDKQTFPDVMSELYGPKTNQELRSNNSRKTDTGTAGDAYGEGQAYLDMDTGEVVKSDAAFVGEGQDADRKPGEQTSAYPHKEADKMMDWFGKNFDTLDFNHDGRLSGNEMDAGLLHPKLANEEDGSTYLAAIQENNGQMARVAEALSKGKNDLPAPDPNAPPDGNEVAITKQGFQAIKARLGQLDSTQVREALTIASLSKSSNSEQWAQADINGDNAITREELENALKSDKLSPETRTAFGLLHKNFDRVSKTTDDTVSAQQNGGVSYKIEPKEMQTNPKVQFVSKIDVSKYASGIDKFLTGLDSTIDYAGSRLSTDGQGVIGDCFVLAPSQRIEENKPDFFKSMFKNNGDNTSTVTFANDKDHPVTVTNPTLAERKTFASGRDSLQPIMEKAYAQRMVNEWGVADLFEAKPASKGKEATQAIPVQRMIRGGDPSVAMELLTGHKPQTIKMDDPKLEEFLAKANENDQLVLGASKRYPHDKNIEPAHAYAITGFDSRRGKVEIANPHRGSSEAEPKNESGQPVDGKLDGKFKISIYELRQAFDFIYVSPLDRKE